MSGLIVNPGRIWLVIEPVDMRRGIDGLSMIIQQSLGYSPCSGSAFVFCNCAGNRIKVLLWDGTGVWLCQCRLHQGCFEMTDTQWEWLTAGVDWRRLSALPSAHLQVWRYVIIQY